MNATDGIGLAISAAQSLADGIPVPLLSTTLGVLKQVIKACQNAEANKWVVPALGLSK